MIRPPHTPEEIYEMAVMGGRMHQESAFAHLPYDPAQVTQYALDLAKQNRAFLARIEQEGKLVGFFGGRLDRYFFNQETVATDFAFFVEPAWRGRTRDVIRCIETFKRWAMGRNAREVCIGVSTNVMPVRTGMMLEKMGFQHVGGTYKWKV